MWKNEKDNFVIPRYYTRDWADKYIAYCSGFEDESLWIFDGADIFKNCRPPITQFFRFNELDKPLKLFSFTYPKGVWAEKYKDKLLLSHNEVITFYELNRDNLVDIHFKFGQDFKNYLSEHFRKNNILKSISNLENAIYKSDVYSIQSFFNKEVAHYKNMEFVLDKLGVEIQKKIQLSPNFVDISSKYMVKAWWTDENDNPITEALIGDNVKFHLETQNIPNGEIVYMTLFDDDRRVKPLEEDQLNDKITLQVNGKEVLYVKVFNNKIERNIKLVNVDNFIKDEEDGVLELFFACSYKKRS